MKKAIILLLLLEICSVLWAQNEISYYPMALKNQWVYEEDVKYDIQKEEILDTIHVDGNVYYGFTWGGWNQIFYWLTEKNSKVYYRRYNQKTLIDTVDYLLFDFDAEIGESWSIARSPDLFCSNEVELISKTDTVFTPVDTFTHCYHFKHKSICFDAGYVHSWFAPGMGKIKYERNTLGGRCTGELSEYNIADLIYFIPDSAFLFALISEGIDTDGDSLISKEEAEAVVNMDVSGKGITDLTGIRKFINLTNLNCSENQLTHINLIHNIQLKSLNCANNRLSELKLSRNSKLIQLDCSNNYLNNLYLSGNKEIERLYCEYNELEKIDISANQALRIFSCSGNSVRTLDLSFNDMLEYIYISEMDSLTKVCVWEMPFPASDVHVNSTGSPNMFYTNQCSYHIVHIPDTSFLHGLIAQNVDKNKDGLISYAEAELTQKLKLGGLPNVGGFCFRWTGIKDYTGIEFFTNLVYLDCSCGGADTLVLKENKKLKYLNCMGNSLTYLDVSNSHFLTQLLGNKNNLSTLNVSHNSILDTLTCLGNMLVSLDLSQNPNLTHLNCEDNLLHELKINNNIHLKYLNCGFNLLSELNISDNKELKSIHLINIPYLEEVCVWTVPFPPEGVNVFTRESPNIYFTTNCSISKIAEDDFYRFRVYPNPVKDILKIETNGQICFVELRTLNGKIVYINSFCETLNEIDLSALPKRFYIVSVKTGTNHEIVEKIIRF